MDKQEELNILWLLLKIIKDEAVQKRFKSSFTCNMETGEISKEHPIERCEKYLEYKISKLGED